MFSTRLKQLLKKAGYSPELFSGHSFRRGGATFLHNCGGTVLMIQASCDWSSQCFTRYLFLTEVQQLQAQLLVHNVINGQSMWRRADLHSGVEALGMVVATTLRSLYNGSSSSTLVILFGVWAELLFNVVNISPKYTLVSLSLLQLGLFLLAKWEGE